MDYGRSYFPFASLAYLPPFKYHSFSPSNRVPLANITFVLMILVIYWPQLREFTYVNVTLE